jgi:hypothetical protein
MAPAHPAAGPARPARLRSVKLAAIAAIDAMVAPVVLITATAILSNGVLTISGAVNDRMRTMNRERFEILTGPAGTLLPVDRVPASGQERAAEIDHQLPLLKRRHRLLHSAVLLLYISVAVMVLSIITIAIAVTSASTAAATAALVLILTGMTGILAALVFVARSIILGTGAIDYEVDRSLSLGAPEGSP